MIGRETIKAAKAVIERNADIFILSKLVQLLNIRENIVFHIYFAVLIRLSDLCNIFWQFHIKTPPIPFPLIIASAYEVF